MNDGYPVVQDPEPPGFGPAASSGIKECRACTFHNESYAT